MPRSELREPIRANYVCACSYASLNKYQFLTVAEDRICSAIPPFTPRIVSLDHLEISQIQGKPSSEAVVEIDIFPKIRRVIYSTNAIESLKMSRRKVTVSKPERRAELILDYLRRPNAADLIETILGYQTKGRPFRQNI